MRPIVFPSFPKSHGIRGQGIYAGKGSAERTISDESPIVDELPTKSYQNRQDPRIYM